jgi:hypothetical protein
LPPLKRRPGNGVGHNWRMPNLHGKRAVRHAIYDTNFWKSFIQARLAVPMGDRGCLSLFGDRPELHRLFAEHLTAEYRVKTESRGRTVDEWKLRPSAGDNHWFDGLVGCAVAASIQGGGPVWDGQRTGRPAPADQTFGTAAGQTLDGRRTREEADRTALARMSPLRLPALQDHPHRAAAHWPHSPAEGLPVLRPTGNDLGACGRRELIKVMRPL